MVVCAWCGVRESLDGKKWRVVTAARMVDVSHGICPECYKRVNGDVSRKARSMTLTKPIVLVARDRNGLFTMTEGRLGHTRESLLALFELRRTANGSRVVALFTDRREAEQAYPELQHNAAS